MKRNGHQLWTIGHSTHPFGEFVEILKASGIKQLIDIRSLPGSRKFPQFNKESLALTLPENAIIYSHLTKLGGRRKANGDSKNTVWHNKSFRSYADYMETKDFEEGLDELMALAEKHPTAIMCAEAVWWRCHRSMVSDALKARGWTVMHIMGKENETEHPYTQPAKIINGRLSYQADED